MKTNTLNVILLFYASICDYVEKTGPLALDSDQIIFLQSIDRQKAQNEILQFIYQLEVSCYINHNKETSDWHLPIV